MKKTIRTAHILVLAWAACLVVAGLLTWQPALGLAPITYTVNDKGDLDDTSPGNGTCATIGGKCTLRAALTESNAHPGHDVIVFSVTGMISPESALPALSDVDGVTIQAHNTITLFGGFISGVDGLVLNSNGNIIQGLHISDFDNGLIIYGDDNLIGTDGDGVTDEQESNYMISSSSYGLLISGDNNHIHGNMIGVSGGTAFGNADDGMVVFGSNNVIGTDGDGVGDLAERNVISNNGGHGIRIDVSGVNPVTGNVVAGNYIGVDPYGTSAMQNQGSGVLLDSGTTWNRVGTNGDGISDDLERNVISGNVYSGVRITASGTSHNLITGNFIGVNAAGTAAIPNQQYGILSINGADENWIGVDPEMDNLIGNLVSGNGDGGIEVETDSNYIAGNHIGTDITGEAAISNQGHGLELYYAASNWVGTNSDGINDDAERNWISGNTLSGIRIRGSGAISNRISGNYIGTAEVGDGGIPNGDHGILIEDAASNTIIGTDGNLSGDTAEGNVISGNGKHGIYLNDDGGGTVIAGNTIGLAADGMQDVSNGDNGIYLENNSSVMIGGDISAERNVISGNGYMGIYLYGCTSVTIMGNYIGTNPSGSAAIPNAGSGILVAESSSITIGGTLSVGQRNVVSGNLGSGINLYSSTGVSIYGNYIGVGANLSALGNGGAGVWLSTQSASNTIGSTGTRAGNRIANNLSGVNLASSAYSANSIRGNNIYANENLGIDLLDNGVTANDIGDGDTGPNDLMNYPVVQTATSDGDGTRITGYFSSQANLTVNIDFYRSAICAASGYGEGENLVGSVQVATDGSGVIFFDESFSYEVPDGYAITATATDEDGNTSEFSACMEVQGRELAKIYLPFIARKP